MWLCGYCKKLMVTFYYCELFVKTMYILSFENSQLLFFGAVQITYKSSYVKSLMFTCFKDIINYEIRDKPSHDKLYFHT